MTYTAIYIDNPNLSEKVDEFPIDFDKFLTWWNNGGAAIWMGSISESNRKLLEAAQV